MRFTGKLAFEQIARRKSEGEPDLDDKFRIIAILRDFGLHGLTGEVTKVGDDAYRLPDLLIKNCKPEIVIELDGEMHGNGEQITKRPRDETRDSDYIRNGYRLIIINKEQTNGYETEKVIKLLEENGLKKL